MPTYTYRCKNCSHQLEEFQKISDDPLVTCPSCKQDTLVRIIDGGAGLVFKGSGFYLTDYKKTGSSPETKSSTSDTKSESKSDTKPASKPESKSSDSKSSPGGSTSSSAKD